MLLMDNAPQTGILYATFIDKMVCKKYTSLSEIEEYLTEEGLLELHLFDSEKELRFLKTRNKGLQRFEITEATEYDDKYEEIMYVAEADKRPEKIAVVNYIRYDENDMLRIVNYRLKEVE